MPTARVLVVDDSPTMRQFILFALQRLPGVLVDEAGDGVSALKQLSAAAYDLLMTDIHMPLMDGLKLVDLVRKDAHYAALPIIVITTEGSEFSRERALKAGADAYVTKPLQTAELITVVRRLLDPEQLRDLRTRT